MIGSSTVRSDSPVLDTRWGETCSSFLKAVAAHRSKASASYYYRNHLQYFDGLFRSLMEVNRVLESGAPCVLVVQDSFYKEIHNDLAAVVVEMGHAFGWQLSDRHDYPSTRHMGRAHPGTKTYGRSAKAVESVLILRTAD